MSEKLFVVNDFNQEISLKNRETAIGNKLWRRASGGIVYDPYARKVLCHKRSKNKDERPDYWVSVFGGKVLSEENFTSASIREIHEEFGILMNQDALIFLGYCKANSRKQFEYFHIVFQDSSNTRITPDPSEVSEYRWVSDTECIKNLRSSKDWYCYGYEIPVIRLTRKALEAQHRSDIMRKKIPARILKPKPLKKTPPHIVDLILSVIPKDPDVQV